MVLYTGIPRRSLDSVFDAISNSAGNGFMYRLLFDMSFFIWVRGLAASPPPPPPRTLLSGWAPFADPPTLSFSFSLSHPHIHTQVSILLFNVLTGLIVDSFRVHRNAETARDLTLANECFICGFCRMVSRRRPRTEGFED